MPQAVRGDVGMTGVGGEGGEPVAQSEVVSLVEWSMSAENSHNPNRCLVSRCCHVRAVSRHNLAVVAQRERRRVRPVLVGPTTSLEDPRAIVSTSPSRVGELQRGEPHGR